MASEIEPGQCCNEPDIIQAVIPIWPFRGKICANCGELSSDMPYLIEMFWIYCVAPFWNGAALLVGPQEQIERIPDDR